MTSYKRLRHRKHVIKMTPQFFFIFKHLFLQNSSCALGSRCWCLVARWTIGSVRLAVRRPVLSNQSKRR